MSWQISLILIILVVIGLFVGLIFSKKDELRCPNCKGLFCIEKGEKKISKGHGTWGETKIVKVDCECKKCKHKWQTKEEIDQKIET